MERPADYTNIQAVLYDGDIWESNQTDPELADLMNSRDRLIILRAGEPPYRVVFGVPHHSTPGSGKICEHRLDEAGRPHPREADENSAGYAVVAFDRARTFGLPCKLVIMAHATTHDPNKHLDSPYCREVFSEQAGLLFECHGSARRRRLPLELSGGLNGLADRLRFGRRLAEALAYRYDLGVQAGVGEWRALVLGARGREAPGLLELPARKTLSLLEAGRRGIPALHLEAKPLFRKMWDGSTGIPAAGWILGQAISSALAGYLR